MGYEIHIIREELGTSDYSITKEEWGDYVNSDESINRESEGSNIYIWHNHPLGGIDEELPWLRYSDGRISTRKPDEFLTLKMFEIAKALHACLANDEGILDEKYREELIEYTDRTIKRGNLKSPWWRFW